MNPAVLSSTTSIYITFLASILIWMLFIGLAILWIIDGKEKQELVLHTILAVTLSWIFSEMIKGVFPTLRPYQVNGTTPLTLTLMHSSGSFPSSHTAVAFALAFGVWLHDRKVGLFFLLAALGVGVGRVLGNVHYPFDIMGGALLGSAVAYLISKVHVFELLSRLKSDT